MGEPLADSSISPDHSVRTGWGASEVLRTEKPLLRGDQTPSTTRKLGFDDITFLQPFQNYSR
jgi:hypothetical protein